MPIDPLEMVEIDLNAEGENDEGGIRYLARFGLSRCVPAWRAAGADGLAVIAESIDALAREVVRLREEIKQSQS